MDLGQLSLKRTCEELQDGSLPNAVQPVEAELCQLAVWVAHHPPVQLQAQSLCQGEIGEGYLLPADPIRTERVQDQS